MVDNGTVQNYTWSGNLAGGHSTIVILPAINTSSGSHVITIYCMTDTLRGSFASGFSPVVNLGADTAQCGGTVILNAQNSGSQYLWSTGATLQSITVVQSGLYSVTVTSAQTCSATDSVEVSIYELPMVNWQLVHDTVCSNSGIISLGGGSPAGGVFSGTDVVNNRFDPAVAGSGSYVINYTYTDSNGCHGSAPQNIYVEVCASIAGVRGYKDVEIFPNPNISGWLNVKVDVGYVGSQVFIFDASGRMMKQYLLSSENEQLNISQLAGGVYMLRIGEKFKKLIVE